MKNYFLRQISPFVGGIRECVFSDMDYLENVLVLEEKSTGEEISGTVSFGYESVTLTTRGYVEYEILAFVPE